jgi:hypothetical protein
MQLHTRCPQLNGLQVEINGLWIASLMQSAAAIAEFNARVWPSSLRSLELSLPTTSMAGGQQLIDALPVSSVNLQSLNLMSWARGSGLDLAPLLRLPHLTSFTSEMTLLTPQLAIVRQMRGLTELDLGGGEGTTRVLLADNVDDPHQLQRLEKLNLSEVNLTVEWAQMLLMLPSLTELRPSRMDPRCFPLLRSFVQLRTLCIPDVSGKTSEAASADLLSSLGSLTHLTNLEVSGKRLQGSARRLLFDGLAAAVPQLHELSLVSCKMSALARLSTCTQLRTLRLSSCNLTYKPYLTDFLQLLQSLRHLTCLDLRDCPGAPSPNAELRVQLTPPSALVPSLKFFQWT